MYNLRSNCCKAGIRLSDPKPDFIGDNPNAVEGGTMHYICVSCDNACDGRKPKSKSNKKKMRKIKVSKRRNAK